MRHILKTKIICLSLTTVLLCLLNFIYLNTRITLNIPIVPNNNRSFAKRVVLIVSDGLRYDTAFKGWESEEGEKLLPRLYSKVKNRKDAVCAASFSRAPTESRACHTAMLAGFWEDLANAKALWKTNVVDFDHVLRRARFSLAIGGPDVVDFFHGENVLIESFPYEDYKTVPDTKMIDLWSVDKFKALLKEGRKELGGDKVFIFLHLAGVDTAGHRAGPFSNAYISNTRYVDDLLVDIENTVNNFYKDKESVFLFTSDHGFADTGGHGTRDYNTVKCPFVAWGSNIFGDISDRLDASKRSISQASINVLISTLLGIPIATNNRAGLPIEVMDSCGKDLISALQQNIHQLKNLLIHKRSVLESLLFKGWDNDERKIEGLKEGKFYDEAKDLCNTVLTKYVKSIESLDLFFPRILIMIVFLTGLSIVHGREGLFSGLFIVFCTILTFFFNLPLLIPMALYIVLFKHAAASISLLVLGLAYSKFILPLALLPLVIKMNRRQFKLLTAFSSLYLTYLFPNIYVSSILTPIVLLYATEKLSSPLYITPLCVSLLANILHLPLISSILTILSVLFQIGLMLSNVYPLDKTLTSALIISIFSDSRLIIAFAFLSVVVMERSEVSPEVKLVTVEKNTDFTEAIWQVVLTICGIFLPVGINFDDRTMYYSRFGLSYILSYVLSRILVTFSVAYLNFIGNKCYEDHWLKLIGSSFIVTSIFSLSLSNEGSWLELGKTIAAYIICALSGTVAFGLDCLVTAFTQKSLLPC